MGRGLLLSLIDFTGAGEREFFDWVEQKYHPAHAGQEGCLRGRLWVADDNSRFLVGTFEFANADAITPPSKTPPLPQGCKPVLEFEGEQINPGEQLSPLDAGGMLLVASNMTPDFEVSYGEWYDREHLPALRAVPGTLAARRFRATRSSHKFLSLYHLKLPDVQGSSAWKKAVDTPWSSEVRPKVRDRLRLVCRARD